MSHSVKTTIWLTNTATMLENAKATPSFYISDNSDMSAHGWVSVKEVTHEVELPNLETLRAEAVQALNRKMTAIEAAAYQAVTEVRRQINELLAIEMSPTEQKDPRDQMPFDDDIPF